MSHWNNKSGGRVGGGGFRQLERPEKAPTPTPITSPLRDTIQIIWFYMLYVQGYMTT